MGLLATFAAINSLSVPSSFCLLIAWCWPSFCKPSILSGLQPKYRNARSVLHDRAYSCGRSGGSDQFANNLFSGDVRHGDETQPRRVVDQFHLFPPDITCLPAIFSTAHCSFGCAADVPRNRKR